MQRRAAAVRMGLAPVANEAHFIRARARLRRVGREFGYHDRRRSIHVNIGARLISH